MKLHPTLTSHGFRRLLTLLLIPSLVWLSSCAVLTHGTNQLIPISSNPIGVEVYVDGELIGSTPLKLELSRASSHSLILKLGEQEREVIISNTLNGGVVTLDLVPAATGALLLIVMNLAAPQTQTCNPVDFCVSPKIDLGWIVPVVIGTSLVIGAAPIVVDAVTGAWYQLSPNEVFVDFEEP